ncbi:MAG: S8 family serine peptidase, partial [Alphaproteobacteria bacterium]|nr:S8 family serine peptidase [Alphaproteobacteria bacterium]
MKIKHFCGLMLGFVFCSSAGFAVGTSAEEARMVMQAAKYKDFQALREMMAQGVNINYRDSQGNTPYCLALKNKDSQTAHVLQSFGGTSKGCPGIDPNYRPPRKTYYEEKSGAFGENKFSQYLLIGGAAASVAYFIGGAAEDGGASERSATDGSGGGTTTRPGNGTILTVPDDPIIDGQFSANVSFFTDPSNMELYFTSATAMENSSYADSHFDRIGVASAFARGYFGEVTTRDAQGNILGGTSGAVKVAIVDTAGVDLFHPDFDSSISFASSFLTGKTYDFTEGSTGNYLNTGAVGDLSGDQGVGSPMLGFFGLEFVDSFATQMAGIIGASLDTQGMHGVSPHVSMQSYAIDYTATATDTPFEAFNSAIGNGADVITYTATRNLIDVFDINGVFYSAIDTDYMASSLYSATDKQAYFEAQIDSGYGAGGAYAATFYNDFSSLPIEQKPIFVISTGNDAMNYDTTIEAAAPLAFPDLLGNFIAVTGVDANNTIYRQDRVTPFGHNYTFGSNGCGITKDWCLAAPADEVLTTAAGTSSVTNWGNFDSSTIVSTFINNTAITMGETYGTISWDGVDWGTPTGSFNASYATSFFIDGTTGQDLSSVSALYVPLDTIVYDVNRDSMIVGQMMSLSAGEQTGNWEDWGYKNLNDFTWYDSNGGSSILVGDEFVDFYFIDQNGDGVYSPGDYLYIPMIGSAAATAIVSGGVALLKGAFPHMTNPQITALLFS